MAGAAPHQRPPHRAHYPEPVEGSPVAASVDEWRYGEHVTRAPEAGGRNDLPSDLAREISGSLRGRSPRGNALRKSGSGSAQPDSDVDILQVVQVVQDHIGKDAWRSPHTRQLTSTQMAIRSLFILHLIVDGVVIEDEHGVVKSALVAYTPPPSLRIPPGGA